MTAATLAKHPALNVDNLKAWSESAKVEKLRRDVVTTRLMARTTRARVDAYVAPIFAGFRFIDPHTGEILTKAADLYRVEDLNDPDCKAFDAACTAAHKANGYDIPEGYCPALMAENGARLAEVALLKSAAEAFGVDFHKTHGDMRARALSLFLEGGK